MGIAKKIKLDSLFLFLFLIIFPFGQIIRMNINLIGFNIPLLPLDIVTGLAALYTVFFQKEKSKVTKYLLYFFAACLFSYGVSIFYFGKEAFYGSFYLVRMFSYLLFFNYVWNFAKISSKNRNLLLNSLLSISLISGIFGWVQYFFWSDLRPLYYIGWDDHLYRLVGTFLDPTYLGLIIVFGLILSVDRLIRKQNLPNILITFFLLITLAFTYSRASFLALFFGLAVLAFLKKSFKKFVLIIASLVVLLFLLPTAKNQILALTRTFSIQARFDNYKETFLVFARYPLLGVGFNNMCVARNIYIGEESFSSHSCSGSDSSLLLILATTGIVGFLVFAGTVFKVGEALNMGKSSPVVFASTVALFIHSFFSNSLFFPWIMGYMAILIASGIRE